MASAENGSFIMFWRGLGWMVCAGAASARRNARAGVTILFDNFKIDQIL